MPFSLQGPIPRFRGSSSCTASPPPGPPSATAAPITNDLHWQETLPSNLDLKLIVTLYYGHFLCHVMHQDYIVRKGNACP